MMLRIIRLTSILFALICLAITTAFVTVTGDVGDRLPDPAIFNVAPGAETVTCTLDRKEFNIGETVSVLCTTTPRRMKMGSFRHTERSDSDCCESPWVTSTSFSDGNQNISIKPYPDEALSSLGTGFSWVTWSDSDGVMAVSIVNEEPNAQFDQLFKTDTSVHTHCEVSSFAPAHSVSSFTNSVDIVPWFPFQRVLKHMLHMDNPVNQLRETAFFSTLKRNPQLTLVGAVPNTAGLTCKFTERFTGDSGFFCTTASRGPVWTGTYGSSSLPIGTVGRG